MTLRSRLASAFSSKPSGTRLVKETTTGSVKGDGSFKSNSTTLFEVQSKGMDPWVDIQTGERRDDTAMLHSLAHHDSFDSLVSVTRSEIDLRKAGEDMIASLPPALWEHILSYVSPADAACLAYSNKTLLRLLGKGPWRALDRPENHQHKIDFLLPMDSQLPSHLFCFVCAAYHLRIQKGKERLKSTQTLNPLFNCPNACKPGQTPPRVRIAPAFTLPFSFVQLVMRAHRYGPEYGIPLETLFRRWKDRDSDWSIETSFYIHKGRLLMRVVSRSFAEPALPPSGQRVLLYSPRDDYAPYFSTCAHWRDGELMNVCKCALGHIPKVQQSISEQLAQRPGFTRPTRSPNMIVTLCSFCRPMRRCPECPTEYLVDIKFAEDRLDPVVRFKQAIVVTRWSDLGEGKSLLEPEWAACVGAGEFDSLAKVGRRTISGTFESQSGVAIPGQRLMSLNPKNEKFGEEGHGWY